MLLAIGCEAGTVTICIPDVDYPPLIYQSHEGQAQWLVRKAVERQGDSIQFLPVPWKRCIDGARKGTYDGALPPAFNQEFLPELVFPMRNGKMDAAFGLADNTYVVLRRIGGTVNWDGQKFTGLTTPVLLQGGIVIVRNKLTALKVGVDEGSKSDLNALQKLAVRRGDIAMMHKQSAEQFITQDEFRDKLEILPEPFLTFPVFLAFNRTYYEQSKLRAEAIWTEIKRLRTSKEWLDIAPSSVH
jgi:polar amino acid transport system substrate-binding protein